MGLVSPFSPNICHGVRTPAVVLLMRLFVCSVIIGLCNKGL